METSKRTVADTIKYYTKSHLKNGGLLYGQCVSAVGWVNNTVPELTEQEGIVELPTSDCSNSAIVCGGALAGKKPIYVIRFQGFVTYNLTSLLNYAAKSIEMWNIPCPVFIRSIGVENHIGPVASNMHHSVAMRMPGIKVVAPMTPIEWENIWLDFIKNDEPVYCSEHRNSFKNTNELPNTYYDNADITIFAIGPSRFENFDQLNLKANIIHVYKLKPFELSLSVEDINKIKNSKVAIVLDDDYATCGASQSIAYELMHLLKIPVHALGLDDRTAGFASQCDNTFPSISRVLNLIKEKQLL